MEWEREIKRGREGEKERYNMIFLLLQLLG
jgi:hypothetical protein